MWVTKAQNLFICCADMKINDFAFGTHNQVGAMHLTLPWPVFRLAEWWHEQTASGKMRQNHPKWAALWKNSNQTNSIWYGPRKSWNCILWFGCRLQPERHTIKLGEESEFPGIILCFYSGPTRDSFHAAFRARQKTAQRELTCHQ